MPKLHVAIDIYLICTLDSCQELSLSEKSKNAGICSMVGEAILHNAIVQLRPRNGEDGRGRGRFSLTRSPKMLEFVVWLVKHYSTMQ